MYCLPLPIGPPTPALNGGSIFASAPPSASSTSPVRILTTRMPSFAASAVVLPAHADLRQPVAARRARLVDDLVAARAVVARRGCRDEHRRARHCGEDAGDEVARALLAAGEDLGLVLLVPALRDVLAGEVHDRVAPGQRLGRRAAGLRVPRDRLDAELLAGALGVARQRADLVAAVLQRLDDVPADAPRCARDGDPLHPSSIRTRPKRPAAAPKLDCWGRVARDLRPSGGWRRVHCREMAFQHRPRRPAGPGAVWRTRGLARRLQVPRLQRAAQRLRARARALRRGLRLLLGQTSASRCGSR